MLFLVVALVAVVLVAVVVVVSWYGLINRGFQLTNDRI